MSLSAVPPDEGPAEFRLIVTGSLEYDDRLSLRATLNRIFDALRADVVLVVVVAEGLGGASHLAAEWALELQGQGLPARAEERPASELIAAGADRGLVALQVDTKSTEARACVREMITARVPMELVIQGRGLGLPEDLIRRGG